MSVNQRNLALAIARSGMKTKEIQKAGKLSGGTLSRARHDTSYRPGMYTIGKLARVLNVEVETLIQEE